MDVDDPLYARLLCRASLGRSRIAFNHFSRHFSNPIAFRSLSSPEQTLSSLVLISSKSFDRGFYLEADPDLYTHPSHSLEVPSSLCYHYVPCNGQEQDWERVIDVKWNLPSGV